MTLGTPRRSARPGTFASARVTLVLPMFEGKEVVMGLIRKLTYVGTGGMVDFRSDAERIARYSKKLSNEHKKANGRAGRDGVKSVSQRD